MIFKKGNCYILMGVSSRRENPLYKEISGRLCELREFEPDKIGWFSVELDDGIHTIHTSIVNAIDTDDEGNVIVLTKNSAYTFSPVYETRGKRT